MTRPTLDTAYVFSGAVSTPRFRLPDLADLAAIGTWARAIVLMHHGLYASGRPTPPWTIPADRIDYLRWFVAAAWNRGIAVCPYTSLFYVAEAGGDLGAYAKHVDTLQNTIHCHGFYVDGFCAQYGGRVVGNLGWNQPAAAMLRSRVGPDGVLILHATYSDGRGGYAAPRPKVERLMSLVVRGEGVTAEQRPAYLETIAAQVDPQTPIALLPMADWPANERLAWLTAHGASGLGWVGMPTGPRGWTEFDNGLNSEVVALRAARAMRQVG